MCIDFRYFWWYFKKVYVATEFVWELHFISSFLFSICIRCAPCFLGDFSNNSRYKNGLLGEPCLMLCMLFSLVLPVHNESWCTFGFGAISERVVFRNLVFRCCYCCCFHFPHAKGCCHQLPLYNGFWYVPLGHIGPCP